MHTPYWLLWSSYELRPFLKHLSPRLLIPEIKKENHFALNSWEGNHNFKHINLSSFMALNYWMQFIIWSVVIEFIKKLHFLNQAKVTYFHLCNTLPTYMHINWPSSNGFRRNSMLDMILSIYYHKPIFGHYKTTL